MPDIAFTARFRVVDNSKRKSDKSPEQNIVVEFTPEQALAAATWLMTSAEKAERDGTTVRVYKGKNDYEEVPGFSLWGGMWGNTGSFSPLKHDPSEELPF